MKKLKKEYYFISFLLMFLIILTILVIKGNIYGIDESFFNVVSSFKNDYLTKFLYVITTIASSIGVIVLLIITFIIFKKRQVLSDFKYVFINVFSGLLLMLIFKNTIRRTRPVWIWIKESGFSYPSGHTITAVMFYGTLMLLIYKNVRGFKRYILITLFSMMIFLVGISRIYFGVHYLTDVIASTILGSIVLIISSLFMKKEKLNDKNKVRK